MRSRRELLSALEARGLVNAPRLEQALREAANEDETPWYLKALTGLGAWVATIFFLIGAAVLIDWGDGWPQWAAAAGLLLALGLGLRRLSGHLFVAQLSHGLSLAGWGAACVAGGNLLDSFGGGVAIGLVVAAAVYLLHPDAGLRLLVSLGAAILATTWCLFSLNEHRLVGANLPVLVSAIGAGFLLVRPSTTRAWLPLGHALAIVAVAIIPFLEVNWAGRPSEPGWWPSVLGLTGALVALVVHAFAPVDREVKREALPLSLAAVLLLGAACWRGGPGLLVAAGFLVLGRTAGRRPLELLSALALPFYLYFYYRDLDVPLLAKSATLIVSGLVLLLLRQVLARRPWAREAR